MWDVGSARAITDGRQITVLLAEVRTVRINDKRRALSRRY